MPRAGEIKLGPYTLTFSVTLREDPVNNALFAMGQPHDQYQLDIRASIGNVYVRTLDVHRSFTLNRAMFEQQDGLLCAVEGSLADIVSELAKPLTQTLKDEVTKAAILGIWGRK